MTNTYITDYKYSLSENCERYLKEFLEKNGYDPKLGYENKDTLLHFATTLKDAEAVRLLLEQNPELINQQNNDGETSLHIAMYKENVEIAKILLSRNACVNIYDKDKRTPLHEASYAGCRESVTLLIKANSKLNKQTCRQKLTPLHLAALAGHIDIVKLLVRAGSNPFLKDYRGNTAFDLAIMHSGRENEYFSDIHSRYRVVKFLSKYHRNNSLKKGLTYSLCFIAFGAMSTGPITGIFVQKINILLKEFVKKYSNLFIDNLYDKYFKILFLGSSIMLGATALTSIKPAGKNFYDIYKTSKNVKIFAKKCEQTR